MGNQTKSQRRALHRSHLGIFCRAGEGKGIGLRDRVKVAAWYQTAVANPIDGIDLIPPFRIYVFLGAAHARAGKSASVMSNHSFFWRGLTARAKILNGDGNA